MTILKRAFTLVLSATFIACNRTGSNTESSAPRRTSLVGTWRAADFVNPDAHDSAAHYPLGRPLRGYLVYDTTGHVFFQMVRGLVVAPEVRGKWDRADSATLKALLGGAAAYFGTYQADYASGRVVHRIEGEIPPNIGTMEIATPFHLRGDSLQLGRDSSAHWIFVRVRSR
jgi:hypothetical protein